ncbi:MAG: hypothetical protein V9G19_23800 [Tetrasphaera sp.]
MSGSPIFGDFDSQPSLFDPAEIDPQSLGGISRRTSLSAAAAFAAPALAGQLRPVEMGATYTSQGRSLSDLTNMLGAYLITSTGKGAYGQHDEILRALKAIGATWIRTRIHTGNRNQLSWLNQIGSSGIKINGLIDIPGGKDSPEALVAMVGSSLRGKMMSLEGPNEWNLQGGSNWVSEVVSYQTRLWKAVQNNSGTRGLKVAGPALGMRKGFSELGNRASIMDWGNIHLYTGGYVPGYRTDDTLRQQRIVSGSKPIIVTETGWHNAKDWHGPHYYTPEDVAGLYAPRLLLEYFIRNVPKLSLYELIDEVGARNSREAHFGLVRANFSRKPVFDALANLRTIVSRQYRTTGRPDPLQFSFRGGPSDLRSALVNRGDGRSLLFLWRSQCSVYEPKSRKRLNPAPATATIEWGSSRRVQRFTPSRSANALSTEVTSVSNVPLAAELQILEVSPH